MIDDERILDSDLLCGNEVVDLVLLPIERDGGSDVGWVCTWSVGLKA